MKVEYGAVEHEDENLIGSLETLVCFFMSTCVGPEDGQHLPQLCFVDLSLCLMTVGPFSVQVHDNKGVKVRKGEGGVETLLEFLLEDQGTLIHVLLHYEVTAESYAVFRGVHKMNPLTGQEQTMTFLQNYVMLFHVPMKAEEE